MIILAIALLVSVCLNAFFAYHFISIAEEDDEVIESTYDDEEEEGRGWQEAETIELMNSAKGASSTR